MIKVDLLLLIFLRVDGAVLNTYSEVIFGLQLASKRTLQRNFSNTADQGSMGTYQTKYTPTTAENNLPTLL
jgi:hypothetical protein